MWQLSRQNNQTNYRPTFFVIHFVFEKKKHFLVNFTTQIFTVLGVFFISRLGAEYNEKFEFILTEHTSDSV